MNHDRFASCREDIVERVTKGWTREQRITRRLALYDLWHGPVSHDDLDSEEQGVWGGYQIAIEELAPLAENVCDLYYDVETGELTDKEPGTDTCGYCSGSGVGLAGPVESSRCSHCGGSGSEPLYGDWVRIEAKDVRRIVFGELIGNGL